MSMQRCPFICVVCTLPSAHGFARPGPRGAAARDAGRSAAKAAPLNDLSVEDLELMSQALQEMKGIEARDCSTIRKMTSRLRHQIKLRQPQLSCMFLLIYRSTLM